MRLEKWFNTLLRVHVTRNFIQIFFPCYQATHFESAYRDNNGQRTPLDTRSQNRDTAPLITFKYKHWAGHQLNSPPPPRSRLQSQTIHLSPPNHFSFFFEFKNAFLCQQQSFNQISRKTSIHWKNGPTKNCRRFFFVWKRGKKNGNGSTGWVGVTLVSNSAICDPAETHPSDMRFRLFFLFSPLSRCHGDDDDDDAVALIISFHFCFQRLLFFFLRRNISVSEADAVAGKSSWNFKQKFRNLFILFWFYLIRILKIYCDSFSKQFSFFFRKSENGVAPQKRSEK